MELVMPFFVYIALAGIYALALLLLRSIAGYESKRKMLVPALMLFALIAVRLCLFSHETYD